MTTNNNYSENQTFCSNLGDRTSDENKSQDESETSSEESSISFQEDKAKSPVNIVDR